MPVTMEKKGDTVEFRTSGMRRYRKGDVEIDEENDEEGDILVVSVKLRPAGSNGGVRRRPVEPEEPETKSKVNRFATKSASVPPAPESESAAATVAAPAADAPAAPRRGAPRVKFTPRTAPGASGKSTWEGSRLPAGFVKYTILTLILLGRGVHRRTKFRLSGGDHPTRGYSPRPVSPCQNSPTPGRPGAWPSSTRCLLPTEHGDLKLARQLALDIKRDVPDSPELDLYLTTLQVRQNEFKIPENDLARVLDSFTPAA